ncbi:helix-turn-helix domain-containing protein [Vulcaniibacterium tengchongense]|uniref:Bacteriophage CI repressor-like protein n=1 Tax=Vulcaniibacterium tengchongense TaxID=1273429 RepID=A0A3N4VFY3_9GAMM|nr:helix-turn-helix domain-containing protein [Vulcaniibacterium tengchongense]RPE81598.1 bacteriophage CI repressor-like protein [Vulcaniibacterium tengchongense]
MAQAPHRDFARRLNQALDYSGFAQGRARTGSLAREYDVSRETARKWLRGLSLPELERMLQLALDLQVSFEWLATGRGPLPGKLQVRENGPAYQDQDELRLMGLIRRMPRKKRRALIQLLEEEG